MAASRRVQSARSNTTFLSAKACITCGLDKTCCSLYWQVMHQAAVKSTNTGRPDAKASCSACAVQLPQVFACALFCPATALVSTCEDTRKARLPVNTETSSATAPNPSAARPGKCKAQRHMDRHKSTATSMAATSRPAMWAKTHTSQTTVAAIGNTINRRKYSIQGPGLGNWRARAVLLLTSA